MIVPIRSEFCSHVWTTNLRNALAIHHRAFLSIRKSHITPHNLTAHVQSQFIHFRQNEIRDEIVYRNVASVWKCLIGERVRSIAARPVSKSQGTIVGVEPFRKREIRRAMQLRLMLLRSIEQLAEEISVWRQSD